MAISKQRAAANIREELARARIRLDEMQNDPRRDSRAQNEALHYWDGKVSGLGLALQFVENIA
jgi:hypothetical protein